MRNYALTTQALACALGMCAIGVTGCGLDTDGIAFPLPDSGPIVKLDAGMPVDASRDANGVVDGATVKPPVAALAGGAVVTNSPHYTVIVTLGQGAGSNIDVVSPTYRVVGGVVGATQK